MWSTMIDSITVNIKQLIFLHDDLITFLNFIERPTSCISSFNFKKGVKFRSDIFNEAKQKPSKYKILLHIDIF